MHTHCKMPLVGQNISVVYHVQQHYDKVAKYSKTCEEECGSIAFIFLNCITAL